MNVHAPSHGMPPDIAAQRLIAVPWRYPVLIAACALAGGLASTMFWSQPAPARVAAVKPRMQAIGDAPLPAIAGIGLRLELDPAAVAAVAGTTRMADAAQAAALALQLDEARDLDEIDAALRLAPPAAGGLMRASSGRARPNATLPGLVAGLLLGLLAAGWRELGGERMRSPREAEWALGAPVLGAIPTLSAKARDALLVPPRDAA